MAASGALRFDVSGAAGDTCGQRAVTRLGDIEAATDAERTLLCYSGVAGSLRKFFGKYHNMSVVARMSTVNSVLKTAFPHMWFVGFYTVEPKHGGPEGSEELVIGPYQGDVLACGRIAHGQGVCGTAWAKAATENVPDVSAIENYVACDAETQSEVVVPVFDADGRVTAVLDIDSEHKASFSAADERCLEAIVAEFAAPVPGPAHSALGTPEAVAWAKAQGLFE